MAATLETFDKKQDPRAVKYETGNTAEDGSKYSDDSILVKFIIAEVIALSIAAVHGVVQRLPFFAEWLRESDYGGHLIKNLGLTHINVVAGGTIAIAGLTYYTLPRILKRPIYSRVMCNVSFWCTIFGVLGFYSALWPIGLVEGGLVQKGFTYEQAKDIVGVWHKLPEAVTASVMGIGYWTFVTNVVMTIWAGRRTADRQEKFAAKFFLVSVVALLLGTLQGVYQVLPWSLDWLYKTGAAGHLIDPMSHAHMNLIGGCVFAFAGFIYYFMPRIVGHPIYSVRLANFSFWVLLVGVFSFWFVLIVLGFIEGDMVIKLGITPIAAKQQVGFWHPLLISMAASIMVVGFWTLIANILLTLKMGLGHAKERYIAIAMGFMTLALFVSTSQGILQVLPSFSTWLDQAREAGELLTPDSHAQLNIIGVTTMILMACGTYAVPRMVGRRLFSHTLGKVSLGIVGVGVSLLYITFVTLGIVEGNVIREGKTYAQARQEVTGGLHDWIFVALYSFIGIGYLCYAYNIFRTVGNILPDGVANFWRKLGRGLYRMTAINVPKASLEQAMAQASAKTVLTPPTVTSAADSGSPAADSGSPVPVVQRPANSAYVVPIKRIINQNPLGIFAVETLFGWIGFLGVGWFKSRRPAMAMLLLTVWQAVFWVCFWAVAVLIAPTDIPVFAVVYVLLPIVSGIIAARTYSSDAKRIRAELAQASTDPSKVVVEAARANEDNLTRS